MEAPTTRILLVDDHQLFREGLRLLLESKPGFRIVGESGSGNEAVVNAAETRPDVVVLDIAMPGGNGIEALPGILAGSPGCKVVALSSFEDKHLVLEVLEAGAAGFVLKSSAFAELEDAIARVRKGQRYLSPSLTDDLLGAVLGRNGDGDRRDEGLIAKLSPRERAVLRLICEEKTPKAIALELGISRKTVDIHKRNIMLKLGAQSDVGLAKLAMREGLLDDEPKPAD